MERKGTSWQLIRFALVLGLAMPTLVLLERNIAQLAADLDQPLYYSARLEETSKLDMEVTRLFDAAERYMAKGDEAAQKDVSVKLDLVWARVTTATSKSYQAILEEDKQDLTLVPEMVEALPLFDEAVKKLDPHDPASQGDLNVLKARFGERLNRLGDLAWTSRQKRMSELVQHNLGAVTLMRFIQTCFVIMTAIGLSLLLVELWSTRRLNRRLNEMVEEKQHLLRTDMLTGIRNRAAFEAQLAALHGEEKRNFSAIYLDLDGFKKVNDAFGHAAGDVLLKEVATIMLSLAGSEDSVARFGGDEFAALIIGSRARAEAFVEGVASRVRGLKPANQGAITVSVSAGICHAQDVARGESCDVLMRNADVALYAAKEAGRNRIHCFSPEMLSDQDQIAQLEHLLPAAIAEGGVQAAFQPIVRLESGRTMAAEALVRWNAPGLGQISADRIIEIAERTGQIRDLTFLMLHRAIDMHRRLKSEGHELSISVNLSPSLLAGRGFSRDLIRTLALNGVMPGAITFELTEHSQIAESPEAEANIKDLQLAGIPIAVDDFGKAYSNMHRLMKLDFRLLKLDKQMIYNIAASGRSLQILSGLNSLTEAIGAEIVAEGIETEEQLRLLVQAGIRNAQGYYFSRPLFADDFLTYLGGQTRRGSNVVAIGSKTRA